RAPRRRGDAPEPPALGPGLRARGALDPPERAGGSAHRGPLVEVVLGGGPDRGGLLRGPVHDAPAVVARRNVMSFRLGWRALGASLFVASTALCPAVARADVRHTGDWDDDDDPEVTLDLEQVTRAEGVRRLAQAAGWSVVFNGVPTGNFVDIHVKRQPAGKVLDLLLSDGRYVAKRDDNLIAITRVESWSDVDVDVDVHGPPGVRVVIPAVPSVPPVPPLVPRPAAVDDDPEERGNDRVVTGGSLRIEKGEVAADVTVMGGNVDIFGTATGDVVAMGGSVRVHEGAHVFGDATA